MAFIEVGLCTLGVMVIDGFVAAAEMWALGAVQKLIVLLALLLSGCAPGPSDSQLQEDFAVRYPGCELLASAPGEGDDANVYYLLTFRCGASSSTQSTEFLYQFQDGRWVASPEATQQTGQAPGA